MKPLHFLAFTVIAGMFLSACSLNLLSGRHYNLNLVKVEKSQQKTSKKNNPIENEIPENISASTNLTYVNTQLTKNFKVNSAKQFNEKQFKKQSNWVLKGQEKSTVPKKHLKVFKKQLNAIHSIENTNEKPWDWASITALSILGFYLLIGIGLDIGTFVIVGVPFGLLGLLFSLIGRHRVSREKAKGDGISIIALILSIILIVSPFILLTFYILKSIH